MFTLQTISVVMVAPSKIVTGTSTNHKIKAANSSNVCLDSIRCQCLYIIDLNQSTSLHLIPPTPQNRPIDLKLLY